jgi:hypothetical protein
VDVVVIVVALVSVVVVAVDVVVVVVSWTVESCMIMSVPVDVSPRE